MTGAPEREFVEPAVDEHGRLAVLCHDGALTAVATRAGVCELTVEPVSARPGLVRLEGVLAIDVLNFLDGEPPAQGNIITEFTIDAPEILDSSDLVKRCMAERRLSIDDLGQTVHLVYMDSALGARVEALCERVVAEKHVVTEIARVRSRDNHHT